MKTIKHYFPHARWFPFVVWMLGLTACGFHLRAAVELPAVLEVAYIQSKTPFQGISQALRGQLEAAGAVVSVIEAQATGVIEVIEERSQRRVLSVGSSGRATEYELFEEVKFSLLGQGKNIILAPQILSMVRNLTFDENEVLGKVTESEKLRGQMREDLARRIITRINIATRKP